MQLKVLIALVFAALAVAAPVDVVATSDDVDSYGPPHRARDVDTDDHYRHHHYARDDTTSNVDDHRHHHHYYHHYYARDENVDNRYPGFPGGGFHGGGFPIEGFPGFGDPFNHRGRGRYGA